MLSSVSLIWPSDSVSQCHVASSPSRRGDVEEKAWDDDGNFDGDDLAEEMSMLDIGSTLAPTLVAATDQHQPELGDRDPPADYHYPGTRQYRSLDSIMGFPRASFGVQDVLAPTLPSRTGRAKVSKYLHKQADGEPGGMGAGAGGLPSGLLNAIFCGVTRKEGGKRYAQLAMDDAGRWRVVRHSKPSEVFPSTAR